jgi:UDP-N-acetyl-D-glucosamine dehydrogenase
MKVTVIGLGKIGLPLAVQFALKGQEVVGLDVNNLTVQKINSGEEPFPGEKDLEKNLLEALKIGNFYATTDAKESLQSAEVILVCIPLILNNSFEPDFESIDLVVKNIAKYIQPGTLISFETTLPVGTTRNRFTKIIEDGSSLKVGVDFFVVFSPERVFTGRFFSDLSNYPKLVGGVTNICASKGIDFYKLVLDFQHRSDLKLPNGVWDLQTCENAEFAKIAETTYRDVNIGLANEFAVFARMKNIDINSVIEASNSQPYSHIHEPGISVGGHCIPVYPYFYMYSNPDSSIVKSARLRNESMPSYVIQEIKSSLGSLEGLNIGVFGLSYRPGVKEMAYSGSVALLKILKKEGAKVFGIDPLYENREIASLGFDPIEDFRELEGVIIHTAHKEFQEINFNEFEKLKFIFDGRKLISKETIGEQIVFMSF